MNAQTVTTRLSELAEAIRARPAKCCATCQTARCNGGPCEDDHAGRQSTWTLAKDAPCGGDSYEGEPRMTWHEAADLLAQG